MKRDVEQEYDPKRIPAWCDRILWLSLPGCHVDQLSYTAFPEILTRYPSFASLLLWPFIRQSSFAIFCCSDHKPVAATFALTAYAFPCNPVDDNLDEGDKRWHIQVKAELD